MEYYNEILAHLKDKEMGDSPTNMGLAFGLPYEKASSALTGAIKKLVKEEKIIRFKHHGVRYKVYDKTHN